MKEITKKEMGMEHFIDQDIYAIKPAAPVMETKCTPIPKKDWEQPISNKFQGTHNTFQQMRRKAQGRR